jgi:hypothetical protein
LSNYYIKDGKSFFRFQNGREVEIGKVSPIFGAEIRKMYPAPKPPMQKIATADGADYFLEPNLEADSYKLEMSDYNVLIEEKLRLVIYRQGVKLTLSEAQKKEVDDLRKFWKESFDRELDPDDKYVYIAFCLVGSNEEYSDLNDAITARSKPTEAAIAEAIEQFRPDIQG